MPTYFTAGPSQLHAHYLQFHAEAMEQNLGSLNHRSDGFRKIYQQTDAHLRKLLNLPNTHRIYFAGSATEIWERMILNLAASNSFHLVNGSFSQKFYEFSKTLGKNATAFMSSHGEGFDLENISIPENTELICVTQNETSSGVYIASSDLQLLKKNNPKALICVDLVSIAPISDIDYSLMDASFFSVQKAFGMAPGLGVWIVNEACIAKHQRMMQNNIAMGAHHTIDAFEKNYQKWETPSTPNIVAIYILGKIAEHWNHFGIDKIRSEIKQKAAMLYQFAAASSNYTLLVENPKHQSPSIVVLQCKNGSKHIIEKLKSKGLHITSGYGKYKDAEIRIANFPNTSIAEMEILIQYLSE
jgi:phosphoserine aminotransferase